MKTRIVIDLDHHGATKALTRLLALIDHARGGYGVNQLDIEVSDQ